MFLNLEIHGGFKILVLLWVHYVPVNILHFFAYFERTCIIARYTKNLTLYVRCIDDIVFVWNEDQNSLNVFESSKSILNKQCNLKRVIEDLSTETNFLDLTIQIDRNKGKFRIHTYHKSLNLFLDVLAHSLHPTSFNEDSNRRPFRNLVKKELKKLRLY